MRLRELLKAQGAMRASRPYRESWLVPEPDDIRLEVSGKCSIEYWYSWTVDSDMK